MELEIESVNGDNIDDIGKCNGEFVIDSRLIISANDRQISYTVIDLPRTVKRYREEAVDLSRYLDHPDRTILIAYVDGTIVGQARLEKNWNRFCLLQDIVVDVRYRRNGIARALIEEAKTWAQKRGLIGLMLETQDNNVGACRLYERCGFRLRGFDTHLYRGIDGVSEEFALFWYLEFSPNPG